jgi:hypothetical protein
VSISPAKIDRRGERPCLEPWVLVAVMEELSKTRKPLTLWERFMKWLKGLA